MKRLQSLSLAVAAGSLSALSALSSALGSIVAAASPSLATTSTIGSVLILMGAVIFGLMSAHRAKGESESELAAQTELIRRELRAYADKVPGLSTAAGVASQGELATKSYAWVRDRLQAEGYIPHLRRP